MRWLMEVDGAEGAEEFETNLKAKALRFESAYFT